MKTHVLILVALVVVPLFCATSYVREFIAVDSALDSGASYDYVVGRANYTTNHAFIPFFYRHRILVVSSNVLLAAAAVYGFVGISGRSRSRAIQPGDAADRESLYFLLVLATAAADLLLVRRSLEHYEC